MFIVCQALTRDFPFTVLEAMAAGTPVVATDIPGIDEQITPSVTGLLHQVGDISQIARHILYVLENKDFAARIATAGRKLVQEKYDWSIIGAQTEVAFQQAAEESEAVASAQGRAA